MPINFRKFNSLWIRTTNIDSKRLYQLTSTTKMGSVKTHYSFSYRCFSTSPQTAQRTIVNGSSYLMTNGHGRRGGLIGYSALDSGSSSPGSSPGRGTALCSCTRHFTFIVPLSTQVYKWVPANLLLGVFLRWTIIPFRRD